jgi:hypothetical protein
MAHGHSDTFTQSNGSLLISDREGNRCGEKMKPTSTS